MKDNLETGFLLIPKEILTTSKVKGKLFSFPMKCLYSYLLHWSKDNKTVYPSAQRICNDLGIGSRVSLKKYINKLEEVGLLSVERKVGMSSTYSVMPFSEDSCKPKKETLVSGTNETRVNVVSKPLPPIIDEIDWDEDSIPF